MSCFKIQANIFDLLGYVMLYQTCVVGVLGADYMRRAGPVSRAGSVCRDLGTSVKHIKNQLCDYMEKSQPG